MHNPLTSSHLWLPRPTSSGPSSSLLSQQRPRCLPISIFIPFQTILHTAASGLPQPCLECTPCSQERDQNSTGPDSLLNASHSPFLLPQPMCFSFLSVPPSPEPSYLRPCKPVLAFPWHALVPPHLGQLLGRQQPSAIFSRDPFPGPQARVRFLCSMLLLHSTPHHCNQNISLVLPNYH